MNAQQDVHLQGSQRTKWQSFCKGLKKTGRIILGVVTLCTSEKFVRHTLKGRGGKVSCRANQTTAIGMNHYLRKEMGTVLNGIYMSPRFTSKETAEGTLGDLSGIPDEAFDSVSSNAVADFNRANYSVGGEVADTGKQALEKMIELCTDNGVLDKGALRAMSCLANQSIHALMMSGPANLLSREDPPVFFSQNNPSNVSYNIESVVNNSGEKEFVIRAGCDMRTFIVGDNEEENTSTGTQTATIRLTRNEDGSYKANLEDYQCSLQATEGHAQPNISSKGIGKYFREYISVSTGVIEHLGVVGNERRPEPTVNRLGVVFSKIHQLLDHDKEVARLETQEGNVGTIFRLDSPTTKQLTAFTRELSANYIRDTLKTTIDYANTTGSIDMSVPEDQEKLRGLFQVMTEKLIGGTECQQRNIDAVPQEVCNLCKTIFTRLLAAGANETTARNGALNFIFLRAMSPALSMAGYADPIIGDLGGKPEARSTFLALGRMLQYSVNGKRRPENHNYAKLSDVLEKYSTGMSDFMGGILTRGNDVPDNPVHQHFVELLDIAPSEVRTILEQGNVFDPTTGLDTMKKNVLLVLEQIEKGIDFSPDFSVQNQIRSLQPALVDFLKSNQ
jgi:hypothetical protein